MNLKHTLETFVFDEFLLPVNDEIKAIRIDFGNVSGLEPSVMRYASFGGCFVPNVSSAQEIENEQRYEQIA